MKKFLIFIVFLFFLFNISKATPPFVSVTEAGFLDNLPGPEIMPDSPFYFLKIWYEKIITFFSLGDLNKAERYSELAERRLYEAEKMAEKGKTDLVEELIKSYNRLIDKSVQKIEEIKNQTRKKAEQKTKEKLNKDLEDISKSVLENQELLLNIYKIVPEDIKSNIEKSIEITKVGFDRLIESLNGLQKEELTKKAEEIKNKAQQILKDWKKIFGP